MQCVKCLMCVLCSVCDVFDVFCSLRFSLCVVFDVCVFGVWCVVVYM